ncbi:tetratricopeptide repeat protein [Flavobacterium sp. SM2513]|uniref:tetratricopeptide repeat protein n=1 Tax=Flavobacterium sp. SM2513 TaxID=3424766 RepID=UPI003D7F6221
MKSLKKTAFLFFIILLSCQEKSNSVFPLTDYDTEIEMKKVGDEMTIFENTLNKLYRESEKNPHKTLEKIDSLYKAYENEKDIYKVQIKENIAGDLRMLKAELLYNMGKYERSIDILKMGTSRHDEVGLVCNYVKLKKFDEAKRILDSIPNYTFNTFIYANFYETIGKKAEALKIYKSIQKDKGINHFVYYKLAVERINELEKETPTLLNSVYYETGRPDFEVCDADNENRTKIMKLISQLPEVKHLKNWNSTEIFEAPRLNGKNYYWIKVNSDNNEQFNFFVYQKTFEIKYYDKKNNKLLSLNDWRKTR